VKFELVMLL